MVRVAESRKLFLRPWAFLMLFAMFVPELLSGATPPIKFIANPILILIYVFCYGIPALLLREVAVSRKMGMTGLMFLGFGYSLINEGFLAKTYSQTSHLPIPLFDGYIRVAGLNVGWVAFMGLWHALGSIALPIAISHEMFPEQVGQRWVKNGHAVVLVVLELFVCIWLYRALPIPYSTPDPGIFRLEAILLAGFIGIAIAFPGSPIQSQEKPIRRLWPYGLSLALCFILLLVLANNHVAALIYLGIVAGIVALYARFLSKPTYVELVGFAAGFYGYNFALTGLFYATNPIVELTSLPVNGAIVLWLALRFRRRAKAEALELKDPYPQQT